MSDKNKQKSGCGSGLWIAILLFGGLFVFMLIAGGVLIFASDGGSEFSSWGSPRIGVVEIKGPIKKSQKYVDALRRFRRGNFKGIIIRIDSPGGAVAPSQEIHEAVKKAADKKPVVVSMANTAASGGYYIACGADTVFANPGSITGSIGVISQVFNINKLLDEMKVKVNTIKTGAYKDAGSPFRKFEDKDREYFKQLLEDVHAQFIEDVAESRSLEKKKVEQLADGRVFTGRQAKQKELVDKLGTFRETVSHIKEKADLKEKPSLVYPEKPSEGFIRRVVEELTESTVSQVRDTATTPLIEYRMIGPSN